MFSIVYHFYTSTWILPTPAFSPASMKETSVSSHLLFLVQTLLRPIAMEPAHHGLKPLTEIMSQIKVPSFDFSQVFFSPGCKHDQSTNHVRGVPNDCLQGKGILANM